jgi:NAD(P)-dependent dehydrogenase (short-subunit alcohol dehydrogenase family)
LGGERRRILILGGGGLGSVLAKSFVAEGHAVVIADADASVVDRFTGTAVEARILDVTDEHQVDSAASHWGDFDGVLHAVGVNSRTAIFDTKLADWQRIMTTNLTSAFLVGRAFGKSMAQRGRGSLLFVSSVAGTIPHKNHGAYAASKSGLNQLVRVLANELASIGVTANLLAPGYIETDLTREHLQRPGVREGLIDLVPMGRLGTPQELTGIASFLLSPDGGFITGQVIHIDGGRTLV